MPLLLTSLWHAVGPMALSYWDRITYLHTHHDRFAFHKTLGIAALLHFIYRFGSLLLTGSMNFAPDSLETFLSISLHASLRFVRGFAPCCTGQQPCVDALWPMARQWHGMAAR